MSRLAKHPVSLPEGVSVTINGQEVLVKGKLGELSLTMINDISAEVTEKGVVVHLNGTSRLSENMWGTTRSLVSGMVIGVSEGYSKKLEINGVGYRAQVQGKNLVMQLGYSHEIRYTIPAGIDVKCADQTHIEVSGVDKQKVGQVAAEIRQYRMPEPYKGKGIKYEGQRILRKEGKKK